jgi:hypothetical protein
MLAGQIAIRERVVAQQASWLTGVAGRCFAARRSISACNERFVLSSGAMAVSADCERLAGARECRGTISCRSEAISLRKKGHLSQVEVRRLRGA